MGCMMLRGGRAEILHWRPQSPGHGKQLLALQTPVHYLKWCCRCYLSLQIHLRWGDCSQNLFPESRVPMTKSWKAREPWDTRGLSAWKGLNAWASLFLPLVMQASSVTDYGWPLGAERSHHQMASQEMGTAELLRTELCQNLAWVRQSVLLQSLCKDTGPASTSILVLSLWDCKLRIKWRCPLTSDLQFYH